MVGCHQNKTMNTSNTQKQTRFWESATIYFLLTDRFNNGNPQNDVSFNRTKETGTLRGFEGGDLKGITQKINEGYFNNLGVNAIWFTPIVEQIHGATDEGQGLTYGYHGYWTKDWTTIDPNFGTAEDLRELVSVAHKNGIRILLDVVANHTGPVTDEDPVWPSEWVRTGPKCDFNDYSGTTACTLVENLPDIITETEEEVELPEMLVEKWKSEGRYNQEMDELEAFFKRTGYPRSPKAYLIKWITDYVREFGVDGFRVDTVKHANEDVWEMLYEQASYEFNQWKLSNPDKVVDGEDFYMVGEVYGYGISSGRDYSFGDRAVDYFHHGFKSLINFEFKYDSDKPYEEIFTKYQAILQDQLKGKSVLNYLTSHDDSSPYDLRREKGFRAATVLLLSPGAAQIYYGDESNRSLQIDGTEGDATLRSNMNWEEINTQDSTKEILLHWQKLGKFRQNHPSIGAGIHQMISMEPYVFSRVLESDKAVIGLDLPLGQKTLNVETVFEEGTVLIDAYSGEKTSVSQGKISIDSPFSLVLLEKAAQRD